MVADLVFLIHLQSLEECILERSQVWIHVSHIAGCEEQSLSAIGRKASSYIFALYLQLVFSFQHLSEAAHLLCPLHMVQFSPPSLT